MDIKIKDFKKSELARKSGYYNSRGRWYSADCGDRPRDPSRVFVEIEGESLLDDFANRTSRPHVEWRPLVLQALREAGVEFTGIRWSRKAGCKMCACSPGFYVHGHTGADFWLTIEADEPQRTDDAEAAHRAEQLLGRV